MEGFVSKQLAVNLVGQFFSGYLQCWLFFFILSQDFTFHPKGISILLDPQKGPVIFHENVLLL